MAVNVAKEVLRLVKDDAKPTKTIEILEKRPRIGKQALSVPTDTSTCEADSLTLQF